MKMCKGGSAVAALIKRAWPGCLVLFTSANAATLEWPPPQPVQQRISAAVELIGQIESALPSPIADVERLAEHLDFDIEAAIDHVRDEVQFEPYTGVLRGPEGTVIAGSGNAWDQALLLASLLKTMGADAQIAVGSLEKPQARILLSRAFSTHPGTKMPFDAAGLIDTVSRYDARFAKTLDQQITTWRSPSSPESLENQVVKITTELQAMLTSADVHFSQTEPVDELVAMLAADYAWVRWRDGPANEWADIHPTFPADNAPQPHANRFLAESVPPEYQHRVALQLWIERSKTGRDDNVERLPVMDRFEGPTAELFKDQIALGMSPLSADDEGSKSFLVPILNDGIAPGGQAVTAQGLTADAGDVASAAAELFSTLAGRMGESLGALGDESSGQPGGPRLTGILLSAEITGPGRQPRTVERRLVDLRHSAQFEFPEAGAFELMVGVDIGPQDVSQITHRMVTQQKALLQAIPVFYALGRGGLTLEQAQQSQQFKNLDKSSWLDFDLLSRFSIDVRTSAEFTFRPGPLVAVRRTFVDPIEGFLSTVDILHNPSTVLTRGNNGAVVLNPGRAVKQGVRDTVLESYLLPSARQWSEQSPARLVVGNADLESDEQISAWPERAREMAKQDIASGYVLALTHDSEPHWWRVHPKSGATLGMGQYGGQSVTEYVVMVIAAALSAWLFKQSVESCDKRYSDNQRMADCCIVGNLITTYGTAALGGAISLPSLPAAAFVEYPWLTALGYIFVALSYEASYNTAIGAASSGPIDSICGAYTGQ